MADVHTPVADVLNAAADLAAVDWGQKSYCNCVNGHIMRAEGREDNREIDSGGCKAFAAFLGLEHVFGVLSWNDAPERTQAEVVQALRDAARMADNA